MGALETLRSTTLDLPFIIVSGEIGEDVAVAAMRAGVDDYLLKDRLARLGPAIEVAIERGAARRARRYAEDELRISEARLAALTSHLETLKERERSQVARDLHDEIGNALATVHFEVAGLVRRNNRDTESTKSLTTIRETVDRAVATMQRMMLNLRPSILDAGLVAALEWLVRECGRRADVKVSFTSNREDIDVAAEVSTAAFRICQEALNNALRHANATELQVELFSDNQNFTLEVRDNGQGFSKEEMNKDGAFGILGMQARARSLGGWIETSSSAHGTSIMLSLPLRTVLRGSVTP
jgi:signal transduction histidine kinase